MITLHNVADVPLWAMGISSVLFKLMPPPEKFNDWPRFQGGYKLVYTFVSWIALNK
jgi:hypothetical protein